MSSATSHLVTPNIPPALLSIEEYLSTSYHPDCDFVDGFLEERTVGDSEHSFLQGVITTWFGTHRKEWDIDVYPEYRARVSSSRVRVPDICIAPRQFPREKVRVTPPLLCIEVLSPDDRLPRVVIRLQDYLKMGVKNIWLIDPIERAAFTYTAGGLLMAEGPRLTIVDSPIYLDLPEIFSALD